MIYIDEFSKKLLEESKRFLEKADEEVDEDGKIAYIHASIVLGFCALEAYVNTISDELLITKNIPLVNKSILSEKDIELRDGKFRLSTKLKIYRLEDRIQFLVKEYSGKKIDNSLEWWSTLKLGLHIRNQIVHPKGVNDITLKQAKKILLSIISTIDFVFHAVYGKGFPPFGKGLMSSMKF